MFLVGIIPGNGKKEAHSIHPYLEVLVDELISLNDVQIYDAYKKASFKLKVDILFYILDYPGVGKVFNIHGAGSYAGCLWCDTQGTYCKTLSKMVYLGSRRFLPMSSPLRKDKKNFPSKAKELLPPPRCRTYAAMKDNHLAYENASCKSQATLIAKTTGCRGSYPLQKLKFHNPVQQCVPDAMHTVKDAIEHFFYLIIGRDDCTKIIASEAELKRFKVPKSKSTVPVQKGRKVNTGSLPYRIDKEQKKEADVRACSVICPEHVDFTTSAFFSKTHFKSHDWKQIVSLGILKYCLRGFLPNKQQKTFFFFLDVMSRVLQESHEESALKDLEKDVNEALALLERDFPMSKQVMCVHLLHHVVPGIKQYGPVYGTWMYCFERFNSWMCRRALNRTFPEATVMETYRVFEWCNYMLHSAKDQTPRPSVITSGAATKGVLEVLYVNKLQVNSVVGYSDILSEYERASSRALNARNKSQFPHTSEWNPIGRRLSSVERKLLLGPSEDVMFYKKLSVCDKKTNRLIHYSTRPSDVQGERISSSFIFLREESPDLLDQPKFASIVSLFSHTFMETTTFWAIVDLFPQASYDNYCKMWCISSNDVSDVERTVAILSTLSDPLVVAYDKDNNLWFLSYIRSQV